MKIVQQPRPGKKEAVLVPYPRCRYRPERPQKRMIEELEAKLIERGYGDIVKSHRKRK